MSKKKNHGSAPVPPGNRQHGVPAGPNEPEESSKLTEEVDYQEEDPKRRLGDFTGTGEHSIQQPDGKNGSNH